MNNSIDKRIKWIDVAKGLTIILVVSGHLLQTYSNQLDFVFKLIYSFHMPVFFVLSGYLINTKKDFHQFCKSKSKSLLLPYFLFCAVLFVFNYLKSYISGAQNEYIAQFKSSALQTILLTHNSFFYTLWFLPCLFISLIITYFFIKYIKNRYIAFSIITILSISIAILQSKHTFSLPFCIDNAIFASFWVYSGYILKIKNLDFSKKCKFYPLISIMLLIAVNLLTNIYIKSDVNSDSFRAIKFLNPAIFYLTSILGCSFIFGLSNIISNSKLLQIYGKNSLYIYGFHFLLLPFAHIIIDKLPNNVILQIIYLALFSILIPMAISIAMIIYNKLKSKINRG